MKISDAQRILTEDAKTILEAAGLVNSRTVGIKDSNAIRYSYNRNIGEVNLSQVGTFVIYGIPSMVPVGMADNHYFGYDGEIEIDIYTMQDGQSKKILDLLSKIEDEAEKLDYLTEMERAETYDSTRQVQHLTYILKKLISN